MGHIFPTLLCRIIWHYASETDGAYDDCCFDGIFFAWNAEELHLFFICIFAL